MTARPTAVQMAGLPLYARDYLSHLEQRVAQLEEQAATVDPAKAVAFADSNFANTPLARQRAVTQIRFVNPADRTAFSHETVIGTHYYDHTIDVTWNPETYTLDVTGSRALTIQPWSSNVVKVTLEREHRTRHDAPAERAR